MEVKNSKEQNQIQKRANEVKQISKWALLVEKNEELSMYLQEIYLKQSSIFLKI